MDFNITMTCLATLAFEESIGKELNIVEDYYEAVVNAVIVIFYVIKCSVMAYLIHSMYHRVKIMSAHLEQLQQIALQQNALQQNALQHNAHHVRTWRNRG